MTNLKEKMGARIRNKLQIILVSLSLIEDDPQGVYKTIRRAVFDIRDLTHGLGKDK